MLGDAQWAVQLDAFGKSYAGGWTRTKRQAVSDMSFCVAAGQVLGLFGPNGSGKSTTLKALAGLLTPTRGRCLIHGHRAGSLAARICVGYLPDSPRFSPRQTARELVTFHAALSNLPRPEGKRRGEALLHWAGLEADASRPVATFSKGMRQRLGLALALLSEPTVVLLDEPSSGLDPEGRLLVNRLIKELAEQGRTVVFTSHLLAQAETLCDRVAILGRGRLLAEGPPSHILADTPAQHDGSTPLERLYLKLLHGNDSK